MEAIYLLIEFSTNCFFRYDSYHRTKSRKLSKHNLLLAVGRMNDMREGKAIDGQVHVMNFKVA